MQKPAFIFDMDGTLVDNMSFHIQTWQHFLADFGITMTEAEFHQQTRGTIEEAMRRIFGKDLTDDEVASLANRKESCYRALYRPHMQPIAGLVPFLQAAQALHIPMALGTSAMQPNIDLVLDGLDIAGYFKVCVGGDDVNRGKPDPETFLMAAQKLGVEPESCIVFEDTVTGIEAAQNAAMAAIALTTTLPASAFEKLANVRQIMPNYSQLHAESLVL